LGPVAAWERARLKHKQPGLAARSQELAACGSQLADKSSLLADIQAKSSGLRADWERATMANGRRPVAS